MLRGLIPPGCCASRAWRDDLSDSRMRRSSEFNPCGSLSDSTTPRRRRVCRRSESASKYSLAVSAAACVPSVSRVRRYRRMKSTSLRRSDISGATLNSKSAISIFSRPSSSGSRVNTCFTLSAERRSAMHTLPWSSLHIKKSHGAGENCMVRTAPAPVDISGLVELITRRIASSPYSETVKRSTSKTVI